MNTNQGKRMEDGKIEMMYCGKDHQDAVGDWWRCGKAEGACPSCLLAHIAKQDAALEAAQGELAALRGQAEELATLREIVRLLDEARERYAKHPRGAGGQRMADEIDKLLCRLYEMGAHPADMRPKPRARALPASRVLGDGEAAVDEEELVALRCLDDAVTINGDGMSTEALGVDWEVARSAKRHLSDIRAAKGGEA